MEKDKREKLHKFIDEFTTRYAKRLSEGQYLKHVYDRELMRWNNGISWFYLDKEYTSVDGTKTVTVRGQFDEYDLFVVDENGDCEQVYIDHDDYGEIFYLNHIQFKSYE